MSKKIIICTGGTGGHVIPAVNFGNFLIDNGYECNLIIDFRGIKYANNFKGKIYQINASHLTGNIFFKCKSLLNLFFGLIKSFFFIIKIRPNNFISFGGYATFMPLLTIIFLKIFLKIDLFIHEQNSVIGKVNLLFIPFIKNIFTNFDNINNLNKKYLHKKLYVGMPENSKINFKVLDNKMEKNKIIFIYGGSQGSITIINNFLSILKNLNISDTIKFFIQSPIQTHKKIKKYFGKYNIQIEVRAFFNNIDEILSITDIAITRAGAGTINDLIRHRIPSIIFPLSKSIHNHQFYNAQSLFKINAAILMDENNLNFEEYSNIFNNLLSDTNQQKKMRNILKKIMLPNANQTMLNKIFI